MKLFADIVFVFTDLDRFRLLSFGIDPSKIISLHNGVDIKRADCAEPFERKYDAVFMGRLHPRKGLLDLLDIWDKIRIVRPDAKLCVMGPAEGHVVAWLNREIDRRKLSRNIEILPPIFGAGKYGVLKTAKVFVNPSYEEVQPIAALEGMACGLPVVVYDLPSYRWIPTDIILTVRCGDANEFARVVLALLEDIPRRDALGRKAKDFAASFDWDIVIRKELDILRKMIDTDRDRA